MAETIAPPAAGAASGDRRLAILLSMAMFVLVVTPQIALSVPLPAALLGLLNSFRMMRLPDPQPSADLEGVIGG
jgi:hypothetical protein